MTTTNDSSQSVHLQQCFKSCMPGDCEQKNNCIIIKDVISSTASSDPENSPTNNNNNNNNNTTTSNSNTAHFINHNCNISGSCSCVSNPHSSTLTVSSPCIISSLTGNSTTPASNVCCASNTIISSPSNCKSVLGPVTNRAESQEAEVVVISIRDQQNCIGGGGGCSTSSGLKITENHLSTKLLRNKSSPYFGGIATTRVKQNQDKSNHSQVNPSTITTTRTNSSRSSNSTSTASFIASCDEDQDMFDNVPVVVIQSGQGNGVQGNIVENNLNNSPNLMGSTSLLTAGVNSNSNGVIHSSNMVIKTKQNGNNIIDLTLDNQFHPHNHNPAAVHQQHFQHQSNGSDCCTNQIGSNNTTSSTNMQTHDNFLLESLNNSQQHQQHHNNSNQVCHNGLFVNSCVHNCGGGMSLATGNGSSISGNSNGAGSMTSPGGSLDEHDCDDDDKVINGDTFATGDLPEPDAINMFVGQVPKHLNEPELRALFEEFGRVFQINVLRDKVTKQSKGCCFVTFYTRKSALDAQNELHNVKTLPGMNHPLQMKPADNENRSERKLFVGMLSRKCTEADVRTIFSRFGVIDEVSVLRDNSNNQSKGCAFVTFASKQNALNAIKAVHHSSTMEGCSSPIVVKFADTEKDKHQKRQQSMQNTLIGNMSATNAITQPSYNIFQHLQQPQQQQQTSYYSQLPLGVHQSLTGLGLGSNLGSSIGLGSSISAADVAAYLALTSNLTNNASHQQMMANLTTLAALTNHSSLSPTEFTYIGANGCSLGSASALALTGSGLQTGLSTAYSPVIRSQTVATKQTEGPDGANLFIYHLPPECGDLDLAQMFAPYGNVISAKVFVDKQTNLSKCFGFVSYDSPLAAQLAIQQMNGFQIGMKRLKVQLKRPKEAAKPY